MKLSTALWLSMGAFDVSNSSAFLNPKAASLSSSPALKGNNVLLYQASALNSKQNQLSSRGTTTQLSLAAQDAADALTSTPLFNYFMQQVISSAVPTFFTLVTIGFAAFLFKKSRDDDGDFYSDNQSAASELYNDLYGDSSKKGFGRSPFGGKPNKSQLLNLGIPNTEYIKVTNLNEKYESYDFSLAKATRSKASAAAQYRSKAFDRALELAMDLGKELPAYAKSQLLNAEKEFVIKGKNLVQTIQAMEAQLIKERFDTQMKNMGVEDFQVDPEPLNAEQNNQTIAVKVTSSKSKSKLLQEIGKLENQLKELELTFIEEAVAALGPERAAGARAALIGDVAARGTGGLLSQLQDRPLSMLLKGSTDKKSLFVMKFPGDVTASQLNELREEVTAIIRNAKPGDEALVILQSGGGTVTGYGLAAGQLVRLKEKGMFLTIAVEQVAASGGYMMTCVADRIVASPFAVLGSIGVISEIPNAYERLKKEGIEFQTVTAGEFKRTLTPTKKITKEDIAKATGDVEAILVQFKEWVHVNRPQLDISAVATGETWFGEAAMEKGLCDEIKPVDDVLLNFVDLGYNVYEIVYSPPPKVPQGLAGLLPIGADDGNKDMALPRRLIRWLVSSVAEEVKTALMEGSSAASPEKKYMARDDTADRVKIKDQFFW